MGKGRSELDASAADGANWHWGIYWCREDPRLVVPKRVKWLGWTLNLAQPGAWVLLMALTVVPVAVIVFELWLGVRDLWVVMATVAAMCVCIVVLCAWLARPRDAV
jgi:hypothetical protein